MKKIIAVFMVFVFAAQLMACAAPNENTDITEAQSDNDTSVVFEETTVKESHIEKKDYNCDFVITNGNGEEFNEYYYAEKAGGDGISDAVFERQLAIKDHLGVNITMLDSGTWMEYSGNVIRSVKSGDDKYQLVMTSVYQGVTDLITRNALYDIGEIQSIQLDNEYWATDMMENLKIDGHYYLAYNDFYLAYTHVFLFNKTIHQDKQMENLYDAVRNHEWTIDKLMTLSSQAGTDLGGDGKTIDDKFGLSGWGWLFLIDFVTSSDLKIVDKDESGRFYISYEDNIEKLLTLFDKINTLYHSDTSWLWPSIYNDNQVLEITSDRVLFQFTDTLDLISKRGSEVPLGILPYPLYDTQQKAYKSLNWNGYMTVPNSVKNPEMCGDVMELLAYYSEPVKTAYYEQLLGSKIANAQDDTAMLEIIWKSVTSDVGLLMSNSSTFMDSLVYMIPSQCASNKPNITSYITKYKKSAQNGLDKVFKK